MLKKILTASLLVALIGCKSSFDKLSNMEMELKSKGDYKSYLALEYLIFAREFRSSEDKKKSEYFSKKAIKIYEGSGFIPESPIKWNADPAQITEMVAMQKRLEDVLNQSNLKFYLPIQMAHLSFLYDCWIGRESKAIYRADEIGKCRVRFKNLLNEIEHYAMELRKDNTPKTIQKEPEFKRFEILFDYNSYKFNDRANQDLLKIIDYIKDIKTGYRILVVGNTDRSGNKIYNQALALKRASIAMNYLTKNGVPQDLVKIRSYGENFPDILTTDGQIDQRNRSVRIYILEGGMGSFDEIPLPLIDNKIYKEEIKALKSRRY